MNLVTAIIVTIVTVVGIPFFLLLKLTHRWNSFRFVIVDLIFIRSKDNVSDYNNKQ